MRLFLQILRSIFLHIKKWNILAIPYYHKRRIKSFKYIKTIEINGIKQLNYKNKLVKSSVLLNAMLISGKKYKLTETLEKCMVHLVTPKFIIPDFNVKDGTIDINTKDLTYKHLVYALLPLINYKTRTDNIALLEDNIMSIIQTMVNSQDYSLNDPYNGANRDPDTTNFNPDKITAEKAVTILAALSFYKKFGHADWKKEFDRLDKKMRYGLLAQLALTDESHDIFHAAYILYKNTKQKRWKKLMIKSFKARPSLYPYLILSKENIIDDNPLFKEMAESRFFTTSQNTFNHGVVNVLT
jgi:hypothetical protein